MGSSAGVIAALSVLLLVVGPVQAPAGEERVLVVEGTWRSSGVDSSGRWGASLRISEGGTFRGEAGIAYRGWEATSSYELWALAETLAPSGNI